MGPQGKRSTRDTEHRECRDEVREHSKERNTYPDTDETNQGWSEQSQKNETQMETVGRNTTG